METWVELYKEGESDKDEEEVNLALRATTSSDTESDSGCGSDSKEEYRVLSKLSCSHLVTSIQDLMECY